MVEQLQFNPFQSIQIYSMSFILYVEQFLEFILCPFFFLKYIKTCAFTSRSTQNSKYTVDILYLYEQFYNINYQLENPALSGVLIVTLAVYPRLAVLLLSFSPVLPLSYFSCSPTILFLLFFFYPIPSAVCIKCLIFHNSFMSDKQKIVKVLII